MPCYHPLQAFQSVDGGVYFVERAGRDTARSLVLPCGQCVGCRLERSRQWAVRCVHEASLQDRNCFLTLTYSDEHLAPDLSLCYRDFQLFMKRLRKHARGKLRFFMCGEYGDRFGRPHFHACIFGFDFADKVLFRSSESGDLYRSADLEKLWRFGFATIGEVTFESAAYVARYVVKKLTGDGEDFYYRTFDVTTGEIVPRLKEFCHMSVRPGLGSDWLRLYWKDVIGGKVVVRGKESPVPRFYLKRLKKLDAYAQLELARYREGLLTAPDRTDARLGVREQVASARLALNKRSKLL